MDEEAKPESTNVFRFQPRPETYGAYDRVKTGYMNANDYSFENYKEYLATKAAKGEEKAERYLNEVRAAICAMYLNIVRPKLVLQLRGADEATQDKFKVLVLIEKKGYLLNTKNMVADEVVVFLALIREFIERIGITKIEMERISPEHAFLEGLG